MQTYLEKYFLATFQFASENYSACIQTLLDASVELRELRCNAIFKRLYFDLNALLAKAFDEIGNSHKAADLYKDLLEFNDNEWFIGEYACFLYKRTKEYALMQKYFEKTFLLFPTQGSTLLKYASYIKQCTNDSTKLFQLYTHIVEVSPSCEAFGQFAAFLHGIRRIPEAEHFYLKSIELDNSHVNNLCNFGLLLYEEKHEYEQAESNFRLKIKLAQFNTLKVTCLS